MATLVVGRVFVCALYLTRSTGKNLEACPVSSMLLIYIFVNLSSAVEKNLITIHDPSLCPQPRERGRMRFHRLQNVQIALDYLKRRQVGINPSALSNSCSVTLLIEGWNTFEPTLS